MARYRFNDTLHSQVSRAHNPSQRRVDVAPGVQPKAAFGPCRVQEMTSESALNDFTMGGSVTGVAWSINPYVGCLHACRYCYVPDTMHLERNRWGGYVVAKHNLPDLLRRELKHRQPKTVYISTSTDPYQAPEREHEITRRCLQLLARHDWPVDILTRSPLVLRDVDVLARFTRLRIGMSVPTIDDRARSLLEPNAPPVRTRLDALRRLADAGFTTYANYSPAYPPTGDLTMAQVADEFKACGVQWVNTSYWRRVASFLAPIWDRAHASEWRSLAEHIAREPDQKALRLELRQEMRRVGVALHTGFFNPPFDLAPAYEGTSQMKLELAEPEAAATPPVLEVPSGRWTRRAPGRRPAKSPVSRRA